MKDTYETEEITKSQQRWFDLTKMVTLYSICTDKMEAKLWFQQYGEVRPLDWLADINWFI